MLVLCMHNTIARARIRHDHLNTYSQILWTRLWKCFLATPKCLITGMDTWSAQTISTRHFHYSFIAKAQASAAPRALHCKGHHHTRSNKMGATGRLIDCLRRSQTSRRAQSLPGPDPGMEDLVTNQVSSTNEALRPADSLQPSGRTMCRTHPARRLVPISLYGYTPRHAFPGKSVCLPARPCWQ